MTTTDEVLDRGLSGDPAPRTSPRIHRWQRIALLAVAVIAATELGGRYMGMHHEVVYEKTNYGYRAVPDQHFKKMGGRVDYNAQGLRSEPLELGSKPGHLRILCLGDSVTNGGASTRQSATYPYVLQDLLREHRMDVQVLNASAPGWATANELGWLQTFGSYGSAILVLTISSHDLFQPFAGPDIVGTHPSFPAHQPYSAIGAMFQRYFLPRLFLGLGYEDPGVGELEWSDAAAADARADVMAIIGLSRRLGMHPLVVFNEQGNDTATDTTLTAAKRRMFSTLTDSGVEIVTLGDEVETYGRREMFRDGVHPNEMGYRLIAEKVARAILTATAAADPVPRISSAH